MSRLAALTARKLLHLPSARVYRRLLHHLRQELLRLATLSRPLLILALLLRLHSSVVEGVHSSIGSTVDASVRCIQPLGLRSDRIRQVLATGSSFKALFSH